MIKIFDETFCDANVGLPASDNLLSLAGIASNTCIEDELNDNLLSLGSIHCIKNAPNAVKAKHLRYFHCESHCNICKLELKISNDRICISSFVDYEARNSLPADSLASILPGKALNSSTGSHNPVMWSETESSYVFCTREECFSKSILHINHCIRSYEMYVSKGELHCELEPAYMELNDKSDCHAFLPDALTPGRNALPPVSRSEPPRIGIETLPAHWFAECSHVLWLHSSVALCMHNSFISLVLVDYSSTKIICSMEPVLSFSCNLLHGEPRYGSGPVVVVAGSKRETALVFKAYVETENNRDLSVHADTYGFFTGLSVKFEAQSVLSTSYGICNELRIRDLLHILDQETRQLCGIVRNICVSTFFGLDLFGEKSQFSNSIGFFPSVNPNEEQVIQKARQNGNPERIKRMMQAARNIGKLQEELTKFVKEEINDDDEELRKKITKAVHLFRKLTHDFETEFNRDYSARNDSEITEKNALRAPSGCPKFCRSETSENAIKMTKLAPLRCPNFCSRPENSDENSQRKICNRKSHEDVMRLSSKSINDENTTRRSSIDDEDGSRHSLGMNEGSDCEEFS